MTTPIRLNSWSILDYRTGERFRIASVRRKVAISLAGEKLGHFEFGICPAYN